MCKERKMLAKRDTNVQDSRSIGRRIQRSPIDGARANTFRNVVDYVRIRSSLAIVT